MVEVLLKNIYNKTINVIQETLNDNTVIYEKLYMQYLSEKYSTILNEFISEESKDFINEIVDSYIVDETSYWKELNKDEMLSLLENDPHFEQLVFLSEVAFNQVKECVRTGKFLYNDSDYIMRLEELAQCLNGIKAYNIEAAKELLSESVLDIDYMFKKSKVMSLRLSRLI